MKKLTAIILAVLLLSACQLASTEKNETIMGDKLVGVFVTFGPLDLAFDIEGYIRDNGVSDGEVITGGNEYEGRLYAELGETGWSFPGYEGLIMGQRWCGDHWSGFTTEGFGGTDTHVTGTDTLDQIEETSTIYVPRDTENFTFYCNPVYMTPEGEYYAVQGDSFTSGTEEIYGMSQSVSDEQTWTEDDVTYTYSAKYTTCIEGVQLADTVTLIQMSADHEELARAEYTPGDMPESITPEADTAYLIVEESAADSITRTLYQPGDEHVKVFCKTDHVYCLPQFTEICWAE